jgi:hypothetical protein
MGEDKIKTTRKKTKHKKETRNDYVGCGSKRNK